MDYRTERVLMVSKVVSQGEISLNAVKHRIIGPVSSALSSIYPQKQVNGDFTRDSQQYASVMSLSDARGGIGLARQRGTGDVFNRCWWSTCNISGHEHLVLPPLATLTAATGVAGVFTVGAIGELSSEIYAAFGTSVRKYNNTTDSWGSSLATLPAVATHALTFRMAGTVYLAFATTGGYTYTSDGITWNDDTKDAQFLASWDDRLWGIDSTGQLWFSTAIGVETNDAQLPLPNSSVTNLFVGPLPNGDLVLHAATTYGLFSHDVDNSKFIKTRLVGAQHPDNGKGSISWRDSIFFSSGNGTHRYAFSGGDSTISVMGPDRDDGLPSDKRGVIRQLLDSTNDLLAIFDATSAPGSLNMFDSSTALNAADVIPSDTGFSHILGWSGGAPPEGQRGWEVKWLGGSSAQAISYAYVSYAYSTYRLWWAHNQRVYYMSLPRDIVNPSEITTYAYAASADHETFWFNADQVEVDKLALELRVETSGCSSTETVVVSYGLNYASSYTNLGTITSNGVTTYYFPSGTDAAGANTGTEFRAMRFKISLARGSTTTLTPDVISVTLSYRKKLPAKYVHQFEIDLNGSYDGRSPAERRAALKTAIEVNTKVEFTFREDGVPLYVDVVQASGLEETGLSERGTSKVVCVEP
jgi:hypothetical protein